MTSDYLKQLQLTKQLEQKAKEAARNRKATEDKFAVAQKLLAEAAEMGVASDEVQSDIAAAQAAQSKRDYSAALAAVTKAVDALIVALKVKVEKELEAPLSVLALIDEPGNDRQAVEALVADARKELAEGRHLAAQATTHRAKEAAEEYADTRMSAMFSQVQRLLVLAEEKDVPVTSSKQLLGKAMRLKEEGDLENALAKVGSCFKGLQEAFSGLLEEKAAAVTDMVREASPAHGDLSVVTTLINQARAALSKGRIEDAFARMAEAEKAIVPIVVAAVESRLGTQQDRADWLVANGIAVNRFEEARLKAEEAATLGRGEEAVEWLRQAEKHIRDGEVEVVLDHIEKLRPRLLLARRIKADLIPVLTKLEEVRQTVVFGKGREAVELANEVSSDLDNLLAGHRELGEELEATIDMFRQARRQRLFSREAAKLVARARERALAGRFKESRGDLSEARFILATEVVELCAPDLLTGELMVARGIGMDADMDEGAAALDQAIAELKEGRIDGIRSRLSSALAKLDDALSITAVHAVEVANRLTDPGLGLSDLAKARAKYDHARVLLNKKDWYQAYLMAERAREEALSVQKAALERSALQANVLLVIGRELDMDAQSLNRTIMDIEPTDHDFSRSLHAMVDVVRSTRSLVKSRLSASLASLSKEAAGVRKNGVKTDQVDRLLGEAQAAMGTEDIEKGYNLLRKAEEELHGTTALHHEVYDRIVILSRLGGELKLGPAEPASAALAETKQLFEKGRYREALVAADACTRAMEEVGAGVLAPRAVEEARSMVSVILQLGLPAFRFEGMVKEAEALVKGGRHLEGLSRARGAVREMTATALDQIGREIAAVRLALLEEGGPSVENPAEVIIGRAEDLLAHGHFLDAMRAVRFAQGEVAQSVALRSSVGAEIEGVERTIREVGSLGIDVGPAAAALEQAKRQRATRKHNLVLEMARRASAIALAAADEHFNAVMARVEGGVDMEGLKGADLDAVTARYRGTFRAKMAERRFTEASEVLDLYRADLRGLEHAQKQCASSLSKLAENLVRVPPGSTIMVEAERVLDQAQRSFARGAFGECLALTQECRSAGASAARWHEACSSRMESFEAGLLVGEGRRFMDADITALVTKAKQALQKGQYEDMDRAILRAARLQGRLMFESGRREMAELVNLIRLYPRVKLRPDDLPPMAKDVLDLPLGEVERVRNLSETVGAVRARLRKGVEDHAETVRARAEKSKRYSSVSLSLLPIVERSLAEEKLEQAVQVVQDAERAIGASMTDVQELRALSRRYAELEEVAFAQGLAGGPYIDLHRQALKARDFTTAQQRMRAAVNALEKATSPLLPKLELGRKGVTNRGRSPALGVRMTEGSRRDREVFTVLWPERPAALPRDVASRTKLTLSYRILFLARPLEAVLEPSG